ncbi:hypothetical protein [Rhodoblastus sp.]|uniref:hypothetical protein n=1 Tax=Rhodoblastus sp. TaxID=1962975 RepID=UPI003F97727F
MAKKKGKVRDAEQPSSEGKLNRKDYERELARLHGELVKLQLWTVEKGLKVCVVFEGRDGENDGAYSVACGRRPE